MNLAELVLDLKNMIGPAGKGSEVDDTGLKRWINDGYDLIKASIIDTIPDYFTKLSTTTLVASQQEYAIPSDFEQAVLVSISYDGTNFYQATPLNTINNSDIGQSILDNFVVSDPYYYLFDDVIGLEPTPTANVSGGLKLWYAYNPVLLTNDSDEPDLPRRFHSILKFWAYANYLDQNDEHVAAERMRVRFDQQLERLVQQLSVQQVASPLSIDIVYDVGL